MMDSAGSGSKVADQLGVELECRNRRTRNKDMPKRSATSAAGGLAVTAKKPSPGSAAPGAVAVLGEGADRHKGVGDLDNYGIEWSMSTWGVEVLHHLSRTEVTGRLVFEPFGEERYVRQSGYLFGSHNQ